MQRLLLAFLLISASPYLLLSFYLSHGSLNPFFSCNSFNLFSFSHFYSVSLPVSAVFCLTLTNTLSLSDLIGPPTSHFKNKTSRTLTCLYMQHLSNVWTLFSLFDTLFNPSFLVQREENASLSADRVEY